jgi:hypothetical protein
VPVASPQTYEIGVVGGEEGGVAPVPGVRAPVAVLADAVGAAGTRSRARTGTETPTGG